ncbi:acetate/CoA ligase [Acidimicrobium ferrooxidans DSM 10331]|uniref:Acetate--CoA ligase n=1 Tax=Acidimicrobium ferrooxidans (strain DSM 10331 / JCM 15462 / NBRC 103882 / ICP) TaxID=525909 RepID=C7LZQ8_ACIFD|nr:acetate--CoA ligase [Acidimicrobium ferrooxidans]ACU54216.1 acetate/CoA ligase [Acidimicrobium ferrooxidans DSM 10331]
MADPTIEALYEESRLFPPPPNVLEGAEVTSREIYERGRDPIAYWEQEASHIQWRTPWTSVLDWSNPPFARWFVDATLNVTESCLDRHAEATPDKVAYYFEGEEGDTRVITYRQLLEDVCRLANGLAQLGVSKGDRVAIYMGMIPEFPMALLACARLGAVHSVVFGGFSADALADRINDAQASVVITCDQSRRKGQTIDLKRITDQALERCPSVHHVVVVERTGADVPMTTGRDVRYHDLVADQPAERPATETSSEDPLYILYTSGTTGKPKGIVHTTGGYLVGVSSTHRLVFDLRPDDVYWCTADIGWVTGHSYIVYGPLANGTTSVLYEGVPDYPDRDRYWAIIEKYRVTQLYTAPTSIRTFMKWGDEYPGRHDLSSLRVIGTVGEPINPEAWMWYREVIGQNRCPVVDTWWQTETGAMVIAPIPTVTPTKPGSATIPLPGYQADIVDDNGESVPLGGGGYLVLTHPWPSMARTIFGDPQRYIDTYWARFSDREHNVWRYFAGDGAKRDNDGYFWLLGRVDDVMNVSGHRISTLEVESALVDHPAVAEAAVIGRADPITGQAIAAFVTLRAGIVGDDALLAALRDHVAERIGKIARPASIVFTDELPKTRSGKIMRRLLRDISEQRQLGDVTTLANADVVAEIAARAQAQQTPSDDR